MIDRASGIVLLATVVLVLFVEWGGGRPFGLAAGVLVVLYLAMVAGRVGWSGRGFIGVGLLLAGVSAFTRPDWGAMIEAALKSGSFVAAFFVSLAWLRNASETSPTIERCGRFLADQRPGRRYLALTLGGHVFGLMLNYGAITLLGSLSQSALRREADAEIRAIRTKRMLLAVQRGFISTLCWSPLSFSLAITTAIIPGATWSGSLGYCLVSAAILMALGWALDAVFKPTPARPPSERPPPHGSWGILLPLLGLLALLMALVGGIKVVTGVRAVAAVMMAAPMLSLGWIWLQERDANARPLALVGRRAVTYVVHDLADFRAELVLLIMAATIGALGASLLGPVVARAGLDAATVPGWIIVVALVWLAPVAGQLGMNPILSVSLVAPLLPAPSALGVSPAAVIVALTAGWALGGASSPFTATTLLVGAFGRVSAHRVGLQWNGLYTMLGGGLMCVWVAIVAWL
jgi:hypothetical protein